MSIAQKSLPPPPRQQGMALLVVLIMLIVVGVMAVTGNEDTQLQTRMLINTQHYDTAYAEAESQQQQAEDRLLEGELTLSDFTSGDGLFDITSGDALEFDPTQLDAWEGQGVLSGDDAVNGNYVIEYLGETTEGVLNADNLSSSELLKAYRITAAGWGLDSAGEKRALAVVQSEIMMAE